MTTELRDLLMRILVDCDSELSAQSHGRPASDKEELGALSHRCRTLYERIAKARQVGGQWIGS